MKNAVKSNRQIIDDYDYLGKSCSVQDCTGLIPSAPALQKCASGILNCQKHTLFFPANNYQMQLSL